jgi:hypothetical protein
MPTIDAGELARMGTKLANDFTERGIPLTDNLSKLAEDECLNPDQIRRVAEAANVRTYNDMMSSRGDGEPRFDKASAERVIKTINQPTKVAADVSDYTRPPPQAPKFNLNAYLAKYASEAGVAGELEKQAARKKVHPDDQPLDKAGAYNLVRKLEKVSNDLMFERMQIDELSKVAVEKFQGLVRSLVEDEGFKIEDLYKASMLARPDQKPMIRRLFAEAISKFALKGHAGIKKISEPVSADYISDKMDQMLPKGVTMFEINGDHPLTMSVNDLIDLAKKKWENAQGMTLVKGKMERAQRVITPIAGV